MNSGSIAALVKTVVPQGDTNHQGLSDLPVLARGIVGLDDLVKIKTDTSGNIVFPDKTAGGAYAVKLAITSQTTADGTLTLPDMAGVAQNLILSSATQTLTNKTLTAPTITAPTITGAATQTGGTFTTPTLVSPTINTSIIKGYSAFTASGAGTVTLTAAQSGQTFKLDAATGVVYTLPAPTVGLTYSFQVTTSVTSNSHEVRTNTGTVFIGGVLAQIGSTTTFGFLADLAATQAYKSNGSTTGGLIGTHFTLTCVSATVWMISGINVGSGTASTPFTGTP